MLIEQLSVINYENKYENIWDEFVSTGIFGTIYHTRRFINYHPKNRFIDTSILIYYKNKLISILPACKKNSDSPSFSYMGATYGGPVFHKDYVKIKYITVIVDKIFEFYQNKIEFRLANNIYFENSVFSLYYLLSRKLTMIPELAWYVKTEDVFIKNIKNKRNRKYLTKMIEDKNLSCFPTNVLDDYVKFYGILKNNLKTRYKTNPTHTLDEFLLVKDLLNKRQALYIVKNENNLILGGVYVIKVTKQCWYTFYISKNLDYDKPNSSILYIMNNITIDAKKSNVLYLDFGISTENRGQIINTGLSDYKENSFGATCNSRYVFQLS